VPESGVNPVPDVAPVALRLAIGSGMDAVGGVPVVEGSGGPEGTSLPVGCGAAVAPIVVPGIVVDVPVLGAGVAPYTGTSWVTDELSSSSTGSANASQPAVAAPRPNANKTARLAPTGSFT
jgi:hypothetical protein